MPYLVGSIHLGEGGFTRDAVAQIAAVGLAAKRHGFNQSLGFELMQGPRHGLIPAACTYCDLAQAIPARGVLLKKA